MPVIYSIILAVVAGFAGYKIADHRNIPEMEKMAETQTFYATVTGTSNGGLEVEGIEFNDYNHRGEFFITVSDKTEVTMRSEEIAINDLKIGTHISITYDGEIQETYPEQIPTVLKIQVLDDEI